MNLNEMKAGAFHVVLFQFGLALEVVFLLKSLVICISCRIIYTLAHLDLKNDVL